MKLLLCLFFVSCSKYIQVRTIQHYHGMTIVEYKGKGYVFDSVYIPYDFFIIEKKCLDYYSTGKFKFRSTRQYKRFIEKSQCADLLKVGDTIQVKKERIVITHIETPVNIH